MPQWMHENLPGKFEPAWLPVAARFQLNCPAPLREWLVDPGSLTQRLIEQSHNAFRVSVINQQWQKPLPTEAAQLGMNLQQVALIRQVLLLGHNTPWVFARTLMPLNTLSGRLKSLKQLENRPLGARLFADPGMERGDMQVSRLSRHHRLFPTKLCGLATSIWGRRSVFYLDQKPLLVNEFFLPAFNQQLTGQKNGSQRNNP